MDKAFFTGNSELKKSDSQFSEVPFKNRDFEIVFHKMTENLLQKLVSG